MRRIAHVSDLHFCRTNPAVVEALVAELNADPPDLAAVSGDLTMRARRREYRAARAFLDRLRAPVLAVLGNHDITAYWLHERFLDPLGRWRRFIAEEPEPVWADPSSPGPPSRSSSPSGSLSGTWPTPEQPRWAETGPFVTVCVVRDASGTPLRNGIRATCEPPQRLITSRAWRIGTLEMWIMPSNGVCRSRIIITAPETATAQNTSAATAVMLRGANRP